jgi:hypothetical protein
MSSRGPRTLSIVSACSDPEDAVRSLHPSKAVYELGKTITERRPL